MDLKKLRAKQVFEQMDADKNGQIQINEIGQLLHNIGATEEVGEFDEQTIAELFALLDVDGDGYVTFDEFVERVRQAELARRQTQARRETHQSGYTADEIGPHMQRLAQENKELKLKLGEVSKALLAATASANSADVKWSGGAAGHGVQKVSDAERKMRKVQLKINELHVQNQMLHEKTDSVVLNQRVQALEEALIACGEQKKVLVEENAQMSVDLGRHDRRAQNELLGKGEAAQFDRDYRSTTRENSALHRNLKEAEVKEEQMLQLGRRQDLKLSHLKEDIEACPRDYETVVALEKGRKEQAQLKKVQAKLKSDIETIRHSEKTEKKKLKKERRKEDEEVAALKKKVEKLAQEIRAADMPLDIKPEDIKI